MADPIQLHGRKLADRRVVVDRPHARYFRYLAPGHYEAKLEALAAVVPGLSLAWHLTASSAGRPDGEVYAGRVDRSAVEREVAAAALDAVFYVTGPVAMVGSVESLLAEAAVPPSRVHSYAQGHR